MNQPVRSGGIAHLLAQAGIDAVYGARLPALAGSAVVEVAPSVAPVLAEAHVWIRGRAAAVATPDGHLHLGPVEGAPGRRLRLAGAQDGAEALAALAGWATAQVRTPGRDARGRLEVALDLEPGAPVSVEADPPAPAPTWSEVAPDDLERIRGAARPMLLAGPEVVTAGAVGGLQALAAAADLGVLNTWGAKGIFDWRSRHHWATVGLQADDLRLGGVADADLILLCGVDPAELPPPASAGDWSAANGSVVTLDPAQLAPLAEVWRRADGQLAMPPLRDGLAAVTQRGWTRTDAPLPPTKVTQHYAQALAGGGFVAAAPGRAGYWVARTFATTFLGGARVPARRRRAGLALACAIVAGTGHGPRRPLVVADGPLDAASAELAEAAEGLGVAVAVELWDPDGERLDAAAHQHRLAAQLASPTTTVTTLATDRVQLDEMIEVAGPVTAWDGLTSEELR